MDSIPPKQLLPELVLKRLRDGIATGEWVDLLPSERSLSTQLRVSRATLRLAIGQLKKDGVLEVVGKRTLIKKRPRGRKHLAMRKRQIVFLSPIGLEDLTWTALVLYSELGRSLADADAFVSIVSSRGIESRNVANRMAQLTQETRADGWILFRANRALQEYAQHSSVPAVIFGNAHEGITLPALTIDYAAALRHCLGQLVRLGHSSDRIALLVPKTDLAGNLEIESAFIDELGTDAEARVFRHEEGGEDIQSLLGRALRRVPRPTAFVILRTSIAARIHGSLPYRYGLEIPREISIACLEDAPFMSHLAPEVTRYHVDNALVSKFVLSALVRQLSSGIREGWEHRPFVPEFLSGESIGPPPEG